MPANENLKFASIRVLGRGEDEDYFYFYKLIVKDDLFADTIPPVETFTLSSYYSINNNDPLFPVHNIFLTRGTKT